MLQVQFHYSVKGELEKVVVGFLSISGGNGTIYCTLPLKDCCCSSHLVVTTVQIIKVFFFKEELYLNLLVAAALGR